MTHIDDMLSTSYLPCKVLRWPSILVPGGKLHLTLEKEIGLSIEHFEDLFWLGDTPLFAGDRIVCVPLCESVFVMSEEELLDELCVSPTTS